MEKFKVEFFVDDKGNIPAKEFLLSLEPKLRAKVFRDIDLLATNGYNLREPYSKILRDGILELRSKVGSNISRVLYFLLLNNVLY